MWVSDGTIEHLRAVADEPDVSGTRYELVEPIGRGGMGTVYLARDTALDRHVALKLLRAPEVHSALAERMRDEAHILARLEHPGILPIHDVGMLPDGRVYYAMKLVRGRRLDQHVAAGLPLAERLRIFQRICEPVAFAHAHGVVHRDLTPANIMIGAFGEVYVMDWGVAKRVDQSASLTDLHNNGGQNSRVTQHGTRVGTPGWMAPEQDRGEVTAIGPAADVFALGGILLFLLTAGTGATETPEYRRAARPLRAICERARRHDPAGRYPDARALGAEIDRFLAGEPVFAYREPMWERVARFTRRHHTAILLVLTYLLMRALLIVFS